MSDIITESIEKKSIVKTPFLPGYGEVLKLIKILAGTSKATLNEMNKAIWDQTGTPSNPVDWTDPDEWIAKRLTGGAQSLAYRIWKESDKKVNPRHIYGSYFFINTYQLMTPDPGGIFRITNMGQKFIDKDPVVVRKLDEAEGMPQLLAILAGHSPAKKSDLIEEWGDFLREYSTFGSPSTIAETLRLRTHNLTERGYILRKGNTYTITEKGLTYAAEATIPATQNPHIQVMQAIKKHNETQAQAFREQLGKMNPYRFESLVKALLEAMGYEDVTVTKQSGDKGIDVVANFEFGITQIKEVVQVKRQQGSITRPILDQLRGALPYHQAIRGTIITLGHFAQGCKDAAIFAGAAPITLIDGDKLMELLLKHGVGVKKRAQTLIEIDESYFTEDDPEAVIQASIEA